MNKAVVVPVIEGMDIKIEWIEKYGPLPVYSWKAAFDLEYVLEQQDDERWRVYKRRGNDTQQLFLAPSLDEAKAWAESDFRRVP